MIVTDSSHFSNLAVILGTYNRLLRKENKYICMSLASQMQISDMQKRITPKNLFKSSKIYKNG